MLLVGLMATGKSTVGRLVATVTGWPYLDNDVLLQQREGRPAAQLLAEDGLDALRRAESAVLGQLVTTPGPLVAGVPAGTVLDAADRDRLRTGGHVVWLRAAPATLAGRAAAQDPRAWLDRDPEQVLRAMAEQRDPLYAEVATQVLDMDALAPEQAVAQVVAALRS